MHQTLLMNGLIIDHETTRLIFKELDPLGFEQRALHSLTRGTSYIYTNPNQTWPIGRHNKL